MSQDIYQLSASKAARLIRQKTLSPVELMRASLARIEAVQPKLNPFCFVYAEQALQQAEQAEIAVQRGDAHSLGLLHGLPIAIKDFTPTKGHTTTRGSMVFRDWVADHNPVIVERLLNAGAIIVGKTTTPEFAYSSFTRSRLWGDTCNPWQAQHTSGGSSGGSAVAVTSACVALAEGTDMGGSVRIPAALCGIVGLKPSLGRIPMDILPTLFDSISHFGPLARCVEDAALFLRVVEGAHNADIQSQVYFNSIPDTFNLDGSYLNIALSDDLGFYQVQDEVRVNLHAVADALRAAGARVEPVALAWTPAIVDAWNAYWGVYLAAAFGQYLDQFADQMDPDVVALMRAGQQMDAVSFKRLEHVRSEQWQAIAPIFEHYDALICPTMAQTAPMLDKRDSDFEQIDDNGYLHGLDMTAPFNNIAQCPALSLPSGWTAQGLPTAVQIVGRRFDDPMVLRIGAIIEQRHNMSRHYAC